MLGKRKKVIKIIVVIDTLIVFRQPKRGTEEFREMLVKQKEMKKESQTKKIFESLVTKIHTLLIDPFRLQSLYQR